jgi:hypothetical protein
MVALLLAICVFSWSCDRPASGGATAGSPKSIAPTPIATGQLVSVTIWEKPVQSPGETGSNSGTPFKSGKVAVYENMIIVTDDAGIAHVGLNGYYTTLVFKPDAH